MKKRGALNMKNHKIVIIIISFVLILSLLSSCNNTDEIIGTNSDSTISQTDSIIDSNSTTDSDSTTDSNSTTESDSTTDQIDNTNYDNSTFVLADLENYYGDIFGGGDVIDINVSITEENWQDILKDPTAEEFHTADVTFNGITLQNVAFRTKGNSSLSDVAKSTSDRYGFKIKTDKYVDDQTINGLNEFVLNACYADSSYLREYLTYEAMYELGGIVPNVAYCNFYINGELFGFYLCVESYDDSFIDRITDDKDACLYKADGENCTLLTSDDASGFDIQEGDDDTFANIKNLITVLNSTTKNNKATLESILDVNSVLKAIAVNYVMGNYDSYSGSKAHNYYLLYSDGVFEYIGWDYNMAFGGFPEDGGKSETLDISSPYLSTTAAQRPLFSKLLAIDEYYDIYVGYVKELSEYYDDFENVILPKVQYIQSYVANDPTAFYTISQFTSSVTSTGVIKTSLSTITQSAAVILLPPGGMGGGGGQTSSTSISIVSYMNTKLTTIAKMLK